MLVSSLKSVLTSVNVLQDKLNRRAILDLLGSLRLESSVRILDLGCSEGSLTVSVGKTIGNTLLFGVDLDSTALSEAKKTGLNVVCANLSHALPFKDDAFDIVISNQVIEHLPKTDKFIKEVYRVTKPAGYSIISTPNLASWHNILFLVLGFQPPFCTVSDEVYQLGSPLASLHGVKRSHVSHAHLRIFTALALRELCEYHGFCVEKVIGGGYAAWPSRLAELLSRVDPSHAVYVTVVARKRR